MLQSLNSGVSGIQQFQERLDVIGNNIANSNTIAFKSGRADFADTFSQTLEASAPGLNGQAATPAMQVGSGVTTASIRNQFTQGVLSATGSKEDLSVAGEGFFMVKDIASNLEYATRAGDFRLDESGHLVTNQGLRVQGFSDGGLTTRGDIQIDGTGRPAGASPTAAVVGYNINEEGKITVNLSDGTQFVRGQILLQRFTDPQALLKEGDNLFSGISKAGPLGGSASPLTQAPGTNGLGQIEQGRLELSNVDLTTEFSNLITTQRGFQASARIITTSDEILQDVINLKR
ncbi:MAG: flagellar hook-basal body complex protein [Verrucomicrobiales bacterium]|nr:flagellar hook-basal body complex protein [Verrucomicrobiales bacterium]